MLTGASQISGVGVWVSAAELFPSPIALPRLRQNWGHRWQPPQQIQQLTDDRMAALNIAHAHIDNITERDCVRGDLTETNELATGERMTNHEFHFEFIKGQHHYQSGGQKEDLQSPASRAGYEAERFQHEKKIKKCESN
ncbi:MULTISPECIES: hypothetical protein [unclassified Tychonema]|uniref:hypothetical protein n=1 Tax=unclassified Tychonema TaxID=2642144 RepID=UPI001D135E3F|nr:MULTISPECIES: hypothetical protein [unclassified Tychonema]